MLITRKRLLTTLHLSTRNCILTEQGQIRTFWYDEKPVSSVTPNYKKNAHPVLKKT